MRNTRVTLGAVAVLMLAGGAGEIEGQRGPQGFARFRPAPTVGIRGGRDFDADVWSLGGQLRFSLPFFDGLQIQPSGDVYLGDGATEWQANIDAVLPLQMFLYFGGGLAVVRGAFFGDGVANTETGYNLMIGMQLPVTRLPVRPFAEARWTFIKIAEPFRLVAGLNLSLRGLLGGR